MMGKPRVDITLAPTQEPGTRDVQSWGHRARVGPQVLFNRFWAAAKERSEVMEVEQLQDVCLTS
jgi:hypothetical protein